MRHFNVENNIEDNVDVSRKVGRHERGTTQRSRLFGVDMTLHACWVGCVTVSGLAQNALDRGLIP